MTAAARRLSVIPKIGAEAAAAKLDGWSVAKDRDALVKSFRFRDFSAAFGFMTRVALKAEQLDHHPEWSNVYNRIDVTLTTHEAGGVTQKDIDLALFMDSLAN
ncbi:MAG: 4a-hydroxytetrahydrobiopterin dehydratase [Alphaproteobacteria bacterium]|nr:4a-hydroxytetrahydrobiopterin dehydratase [Alphaproteobacteria bacterium]